MKLKMLRKLSNPKAGMMESMLEMAVPALKNLLDKINQPGPEGGLLGENDFAAGFAVLPHDGNPVPMLFTLAMNEAGQAFISRKIPISELENALNHDTTNDGGTTDPGTANEGAGDE